MKGKELEIWYWNKKRQEREEYLRQKQDLVKGIGHVFVSLHFRIWEEDKKIILWNKIPEE